ncbi:thiamine phosphate synthase [Larsenimonas rhizosphaerae]|uniref:Thiamine-phosphate synthase n=1 Tax=Larsenimonas rhizosphaerae TaxID=2944682 RepID=A0AA41ZGW7_9GAMM|nr:thiamine phosphate synthase [Larsenimonas rhizosphaerae]MCX2523934.1 thiamine phosphate synthase [Larsenimonas rhizosphaerae]
MTAAFTDARDSAKAWQSGLYVITDADLLADEDTFMSAIRAVLREGVALLQYRNKSTDDAFRYRQAHWLAEQCQASNTPLIINDDVMLASAVGAGVHVGTDDADVAWARSMLGTDAIIGATCHGDLALARKALDNGASYVAFGRFYPSRTKPGAVAAPLSVLSEARQLGCPVAAIGGIDSDTAPEVAAAGADLIAVVGAVFRYPDPGQRVRQLKAGLPLAIFR